MGVVEQFLRGVHIGKGERYQCQVVFECAIGDPSFSAGVPRSEENTF